MLEIFLKEEKKWSLLVRILKGGQSALERTEAETFETGYAYSDEEPVLKGQAAENLEQKSKENIKGKLETSPESINFDNFRELEVEVSWGALAEPARKTPFQRGHHKADNQNRESDFYLLQSLRQKSMEISSPGSGIEAAEKRCL